MGSQSDQRVIHAVVDTGPLLHFHEAGVEFLLGDLVVALCPQSVTEELEKYAPGLWHSQVHAGWLTVIALSSDARIQSQAWQKAGLLDRGEADALALAQESEIGCLLTDDAAARLIATSMGLTVRGSLGLVLEAGRRGLLNHVEANAALLALRSTSLWISERVYGEALRLLDEMRLP